MKTGKSTSKCTEGVIGHAGGKKKSAFAEVQTEGVFPKRGI